MLTFKTRDANKGSFFFFDDNSIDMSVLDQISTLSKSVRPTLQAVFESRNSIDSERTVSVSDIAKALGLSSKAMNDRIRTLRKLELISDVPFAFVDENGNKKNKKKVLCFVVTATVDKVNNELSSKTPNMKALVEKRHATNKAYAALEFSERPDVKERLPNAMRHSDIFLMEQLAVSGNDPRTKIAKSFYVTTSEGKSQQVVAQIQSFSRILDSDDLQVLFACYTLIYLYHEKSMQQHLMEGTKPKNLTPIYVDDVLRVQQKSLGGESRKAVRDSLMAIRDTEYDLYGLVNIATNNETVAKYAERRYRNFTQCSALSDYAPEVKDDGETVVFAENAMIYLVELPDHIFQSLLYNKTTFVFPTSSLSVPSIIFMIYLRLRSLCRTKFDDTLRNLNSMVSPSQRFGDFKKSLLAAMKKLNKFNDPYLFANHRPDDKDIVFNLWGYHGRICLKENYMTVTAHQKEIIEACGLDSSKQSSPTKRNDIYFEYMPLLQVDRVLPKNLQRLIQTERTKYTVQYPQTNSQKALTAYANAYEINEMVDLLCETYGLESMLAEEKVRQDIESLSKLVLDDYTVSLEDYSSIKMMANAPNLKGDSFINAFVRRKTLREELRQVLVLDVEPSSALCEHIRSYQ